MTLAALVVRFPKDARMIQSEILRRAAGRNLPVEPEALAESVRGNQLAPQAHLDAIGKFVLAARLKSNPFKSTQPVSGFGCYLAAK